MHRFRVASSLLLFVVLLGAETPPVPADEGRIPIPMMSPVMFPIPITGPGKYYLAFALSAPGTVLDVMTTGEVDIDLNGFVVENTGPGAAILVSGGPGSQVTIRNGVVKGGLAGIVVPSGAARVAVEGVTVSDTGIGLVFTDVMSLTFQDGAVLRTTANAIAASGPVVKQGTIARNHFQGTGGGIAVERASSLAIIENRMEDILPAPSPSASGGIILVDSDACLVSNNTIEHVKGPGGTGIKVHNTHGSKFYNNVVFRPRENGIHLDATAFDNLILHNIILHAGWDHDANMPAIGEDWDEIRVESGAVGGGNDIEQNALNRGTGHGLHFFGPAAAGNHFGRNSAVGNMGPVCFTYTGAPTLDFCDDTGGNFSFGDNLMPGAAGLF